MTRQETIYADLRDSLKSGTWSAGESLPSLRQLASRYATSVGTVRSALTRLQYEGKVVAQHGSGYYVSALPAESLRTIMLLARTDGDLWSDFVQLFTDGLTAAPGVRLILEGQPTAKTLPAMNQKLERYLDEGLDAILFDDAHGMHVEFLEAYLGRTRLIGFGHASQAEKWPCGKVVSDHYHGGYIGARHLMDQGARHILMLFPHTFALRTCRNQQEIDAGARQAVDDAPGAVRLCRLAVDANHPEFVDRVESLLAAEPDIDAIFSYCDFRLERLLPRFRERGVKIPQDLRLLGYYDTPWCQRFEPRLSSISIQPARIVDAVIEMLDSDQDRTVLVRPKLVVRASTKFH